MLIDTHAHLTFDALWPDRHGILARCAAANVGALINICLAASDWERSQLLALSEPTVACAAAVHPTSAELSGEYFDIVARLAIDGKLVAIGETGLDRVRATRPLSEQVESLLRHCDLARSAQLPLIIHCREAFEDLLEQLDRHYLELPGALPGVVHCFSEGPKQLDALVARGWSVGFGGLATYATSSEVRRSVLKTPADRLILETDCPYLSPEPKRGMKNEPVHLQLIAQCLAELRATTAREIARLSTQNALRLFPRLKAMLGAGF